VVQPSKGFQDAERLNLQQQLAAPEGVIVYKMHGTFLEETPGSKARAKDIIVTEEQYIDFLTVVGHPHKGVPPLIAEKIQDSTLLFLGYSLEDWDFRALFKGLVEKLDESERRKSFAIQKNPSSFWQQFWEDKKVIIYDMDLYEFADELETRCLEYERENGLV
jgi:SIR2-like domain